MAAWSQSAFLQALGWAMVNSFWQMALLFACFSLLLHFALLSSQKKYYLAIAHMGAGLLWFVYTFVSFYYGDPSATIRLEHHLAPTPQTWDTILASASLAYFLLLVVPAYRLFQNWRYINRLKKYGQQKTAMQYRLFVKTIAQRLGIKHTVHVYLSHLVQSPVTIGYIKPIILLPVAAINSLNPQQVEAVLLHELSHIKRYDYLINFIITLLQTLFYFNPFVKRFVSVIEFEREKCCDELVLQFQYDKISYASALLQLEKNVLRSEMLTLAAAGKKHLLNRIEKIVGLEKKPRFTFHQFTGLLASFLVVLLINSLLFVSKEVTLNSKIRNNTFAAFENPFYQYDTPRATATFSKAHTPLKEPSSRQTGTQDVKTVEKKAELNNQNYDQSVDNWIPVAYDAADELVTPEEKDHINQTLETTKKVLTKTKWKEVEASIGDGMTSAEKKKAKFEYLKELDKINWKMLETHLKSEYENLDWETIDSKLYNEVVDLKLDSLKLTYNQILIQMRKAEVKQSVRSNYKSVLPVPDESLHKINLLKDELQIKLDSINIVRKGKIIDF